MHKPVARQRLSLPTANVDRVMLWSENVRIRPRLRCRRRRPHRLGSVSAVEMD